MVLSMIVGIRREDRQFYTVSGKMKAAAVPNPNMIAEYASPFVKVVAAFFQACLKSFRAARIKKITGYIKIRSKVIKYVVI